MERLQSRTQPATRKTTFTHQGHQHIPDSPEETSPTSEKTLKRGQNLNCITCVIQRITQVSVQDYREVKK